MLLLGTIFSGAAAAPNEASGEPISTTASAALPASASGRSIGTSENATPQAVCFYDSNGDSVHRSASGFAASGHGWWEDPFNTCPPGTKAVVTIQLQEQGTDGVWRNAGSPGQATVYAGGGSANRATGRVDCVNDMETLWRSVVDVDLVGIADPPDKYYTPESLVECRR